MTHEELLASVTREEKGSKQAKEAQPQPWGWVERSVWTEPMLKRLEESQERTVWYSLWDKLLHPDNVVQGAYEVIWNKGSAGVDHQTTEAFEKGIQDEVLQLQIELKGGTYKPLPAKRTWIPKLGSNELRPLGIPAVRDRTVQAALKHVIEPILERDFSDQSYGFRPGRSAQQALARVEEHLKTDKKYIVDVDVKSYLDPYSYYTVVAEGWSKSWGWLSNTRMRRPFCLPRLTWTTESSPCFTRCMMVWRDTPSRRMA